MKISARITAVIAATTGFAVLSLVVYVLGNPGIPRTKSDGMPPTENKRTYEIDGMRVTADQVALPPIEKGDYLIVGDHWYKMEKPNAATVRIDDEALRKMREDNLMMLEWISQSAAKGKTNRQ